ncbi:MAG: acyl carrier protein, partial [Gammaproteobacteria bacterium]|nr:acyl carrier protein [Gammaproteobacteria bacterium]
TLVLELQQIPEFFATIGYIEHLAPDGEPNFDAGLDDTGVSSVDAVAFIKKVGEAFNVTIPPEDFAEFKCLRDLATYLESHAG